ncbi:hypothetical protein FEM48_Zijuj09G0155200 [Ziziphus jujuba var. spinosa]|uniref:RBR-type E3 ubiquitin transferase n=1 Tax=Ziziphus jujuba var. spinosa TaxID=714518 RepID=A0A978UTT4_ZIZJJ|nr:hypothetical protein FEM48_Zijuj09G0155200 [Ziziphus jujuba var. spinosa]
MDSKDDFDMHSGYDDEEDDYDLYYDEDADANAVVDSDEEADYSDDHKDSHSQQQQSYNILTEADIRQRQEDDIMTLSSVLSISKVEATISKVEATILLGHYNWNVTKVHEEWFADEEKVCRFVGLPKKWDAVVVGIRKLVTCGICFGDYCRDRMYAAACGHLFFDVGQDIISSFASAEENERYSHYLMRSYVEDNKKTKKWCLALDCEYDVDFVVGGSNDVTCRCLYSFWWNCTEDAHSPVDCDTVAKWILQNSNESENTNWLLVNSKPCPKCKRPIEKNQGCMHMTCSAPCGFQFCWFCLGSWLEHGSSTGGNYGCNRYAKAKREGVYEEEQKRRKMVIISLDKYTHYYERWANNQSSREKAMADLRRMHTMNLEWLSGILCTPMRVLKWTYAYGYYLPKHENAKKQFFEYLQVEDFIEFRIKLAKLTSVTRNYFENLVRALEKGLSDVNSHGACSKAASLNNLGSTSSKERGWKVSRDINDSGYWSCEHCTFANVTTASVCEMCLQRR